VPKPRPQPAYPGHFFLRVLRPPFALRSIRHPLGRATVTAAARVLLSLAAAAAFGAAFAPLTAKRFIERHYNEYRLHSALGYARRVRKRVPSRIREGLRGGDDDVLGWMMHGVFQAKASVDLGVMHIFVSRKGSFCMISHETRCTRSVHEGPGN
jgi:hypothetical protein